MREILFRGKRLEIGDLVEGSLIAYPDGDCYIARPSDDPNVLDKFDVDPTTVGQYTGLKDKHGKRIFEGDIVRFKWDRERNYFLFIEFSDGEFCATPSYPSNDFWPFRLSGENARLEVIGNIHDNPELLGGDGDG